MKKLLCLLLLFFIGLGIVDATYTADKTHSILKRGDVIYFDATGLDWEHVYIHIWEKDGEVYKDWSLNDEMTKVEGTDHIYMFNLPDNIEEKFNMIIYHNEYGGNANQTINLAYIEDKYAYKTTGFMDEKRVGYWYLYDKSVLENRLASLKSYQNDKDYYTSSSYSNLDDLINNIEQALENEIVLEQDPSDPSMYSIQVDFTFADADDIVNGLVVNTSLLSNLISSEESKYEEYEQKYTKNSLDSLKEIINVKHELLNGGIITVNDIKNGINDINTAKNALVNQADKTELTKQVEEISSLDKNKYTQDSFEKVENLLDEANQIISDTNQTQDNVDNMVEKLKDARKKLQEKEVNITINDEKNAENNNDIINSINVPKTLDDIVKIFIILGGSVIVLVIIIILLKKAKK